MLSKGLYTWKSNQKDLVNGETISFGGGGRKLLREISCPVVNWKGFCE